MPRAPSPTVARRRTSAFSRDGRRSLDFQERGQRSVSPLELGLIEMPTRPRSVYTMGIRREAIEECEQGLLRSAADLTLAAITESGYCRGILADLVQGLWGLPRTYVGRADMIADLDDSPERVGEWRTMFPEADAIRLMSWGVTLGVGVGQMRRKYGARPSYDYPISPDEAADWKQTKRAIGASVERPIGANDTRVLRAWSPKYLRYQWWEDSAAYLMTADGEIRVTHLDDPPAKDVAGAPIANGNCDEWLLYTPYGETKPWEWGTWKSATLAFVAERDATFDRLRHAEVLAPARVGQVPAGTTETQRRKYLKLLAEAKRMALYVLPPGLDYKIVESTGRVADIYKAIIEWSERQYAMQTGALTTATGTAGFSKGDVQERFTRSILAALASAFSTCASRYALIPWARENYDSEDAPRAEFDTAAPEDKKAKAETLKLMGEAVEQAYAGAELAGIRPTKASVVRYYQSNGIETEDIPIGEAKAAKIELAPTDKAKCYRVDEVRAGDGYGPIGDDRGELTIAEMDGIAKGPKMGAPPGGNHGDVGENVEMDSADPPTDESAAALAVAMTHHAIERCEHGACNRCRKCGVERLRGFDVDPATREVRWHRAWQPIVRARAAEHVNGASGPPAWHAQGGEA